MTQLAAEDSADESASSVGSELESLLAQAREESGLSSEQILAQVIEYHF